MRCGGREWKWARGRARAPAAPVTAPLRRRLFQMLSHPKSVEEPTNYSWLELSRTRSEDLLTMNLRPADIPLSDWNVPVDRGHLRPNWLLGGGARRRRFEPGRAPSGGSLSRLSPGRLRPPLPPISALKPPLPLKPQGQPGVSAQGGLALGAAGEEAHPDSGRGGGASVFPGRDSPLGARPGSNRRRRAPPPEPEFAPTVDPLPNSASRNLGSCSVGELKNRGSSPCWRAIAATSGLASRLL